MNVANPCPFCDVAADRKIVANDAAIALRDNFPVSTGHTLVVPRRHVASLYDLPEDQQSAVWHLTAIVRRDLGKANDIDGFNIGLNDGVAAGQTVMHAHVHVIPRRRGDAPDPRGGIRWVVPGKADYWSDR